MRRKPRTNSLGIFCSRHKKVCCKRATPKCYSYQCHKSSDGKCSSNALLLADCDSYFVASCGAGAMGAETKAALARAASKTKKVRWLRGTTARGGVGRRVTQITGPAHASGREHRTNGASPAVPRSAWCCHRRVARCPAR